MPKNKANTSVLGKKKFQNTFEPSPAWMDLSDGEMSLCLFVSLSDYSLFPNAVGVHFFLMHFGFVARFFPDAGRGLSHWPIHPC